MKRTTIIMAVGLGLVAALLATPAAIAQSVRTFVSPSGSDSNPCTLAAPCRSFLGAYNQTAAGGEIAVLGTAGYGALTIQHAISIVNPGGFEGGISVPPGGTGILINAGINDHISLRGLTIDGGGVGTTGIQFNSGASLVVANCVIRNLTNDGINVYNTANTVQLLVSNTLVADNGYFGIFLFPTKTGAVKATFNHVEASNNFSGNIVLEADQTTGVVTGTVFDSISVGSVETGFWVSGPATLNLFHSIASYNTYGLRSVGGGTIRLFQSMVTGNSNGWLSEGGSVLSYVDNSIDGNQSNESAPPTLGVK
jgi:hypothetical protein